MPDYYNDSGGEAPDPGAAAGGGDGEQAKETTALLPKSILAGKDFKPGDEVVLKIVKMFEDEVQVEYASEKGESSPQETEQPAEAPAPDGGNMASMMG